MQRPRAGGKCDPGRFLMSKSAGCTNCEHEMCALCPRGRFSSARSAEQRATHWGKECEACPVGKFQKVIGATSCHGCAYGYTTKRSGGWRCVRDGSGMAELAKLGLLCPAGRFTFGAPTLPGSAPTCHACVAGRFQSKLGKNTCALCSPGKFQTEKGKTRCQLCAAGHYSSSTGAPSCAVCPVGKYTHHVGARGCAASALFRGFPDIFSKSK